MNYSTDFPSLRGQVSPEEWQAAFAAAPGKSRPLTAKEQRQRGGGHEIYAEQGVVARRDARRNAVRQQGAAAAEQRSIESPRPAGGLTATN